MTVSLFKIIKANRFSYLLPVITKNLMLNFKQIFQTCLFQLKRFLKIF